MSMLKVEQCMEIFCSAGIKLLIDYSMVTTVICLF